MLSLVLRRVVQLIPALLGITLIVFLMLHLIPGDPAVLLAGLESTPEIVARIRVELGLDQPLHVQFWRFLSRAARGDLGVSLRTGSPVIEEIAERSAHTLRLALGATLVATLLGLAAGVASAVRHNRLADGVIMAFALLAVSTPSYWLALMLMLLFSLSLGLLPAIGVGSPVHYVLPILTLGTQSAGIVARMTRSAMLDVLAQDYVRTARAKGLSERTVVYRHGLRNALIPIVTIVGLRFGGLLAGTVLVESVFAIPGIGRMVVDAVIARDYPMIQGSVLVLATAVILTNLIVDVLYGFCDPRIKTE